ncbi:MAG: hypothetical protein ACE5LF_09290, partial [Alphaproteobacteria bacterium]
MTAVSASDRAMTLKYNREQRRQYLSMTGRVGAEWLRIFGGNTEFYSAAYWDLLTGIWQAGGPVKKTDALKLMQAIKSPHTAGKYVEAALRHGILEESDNPVDARSKLVSLSPGMEERLDAFLDAAVGEVRATSRSLDVKGPSPE